MVELIFLILLLLNLRNFRFVTDLSRKNCKVIQLFLGHLLVKNHNPENDVFFAVVPVRKKNTLKLGNFQVNKFDFRVIKKVLEIESEVLGAKHLHPQAPQSIFVMKIANRLIFLQLCEKEVVAQSFLLSCELFLVVLVVVAEVAPVVKLLDLKPLLVRVAEELVYLCGGRVLFVH